jgi:hydroxypyruvate isomerase
MNQRMTRRSALTKAAGTAALIGTSAGLAGRIAAAEVEAGAALKGRINHSACRWCYSKIPLEELCAAVRDMGIKSLEILKLDDLPTLKKHGLICAMVTGAPGDIPQGFNRPEYHDRLVAFYEQTIPKVAEAGCPNIICFSGNRVGMDDKTGFENCAKGVQRITALAEKHNVTVCMELLNSKINHRDYMCDHTLWGVEVCKKVGSTHFKLLYDIYHMQIMEGDVIRTIQDHHQYLGHYHTGGVPGRHEIDDSQELNYPAIMNAIVKTGYKGYVAQEFVPAKPDALQSLREAIQICDV